MISRISLVHGSTKEFHFTHQTISQINPFHVDKAISESLLYRGTGPIQAAKYDKVDIPTMCKDLKHLTDTQQQELEAILQKYNKLFSGKLGTYPHKKFHIELKPGTILYHCKQPYPVPLTKQTYKE